ncbi:uncharacterized protein LOC132552380 [Ylistrum balloti]|uniref:uncharacterized protein LOC132552380 n=1 Tax=Ylistrum balloti TaxID=509963 RepID=UPI002905CEBB|nr:uncharacterized protein LOC132552380 [Ylistrum balloti]
MNSFLCLLACLLAVAYAPTTTRSPHQHNTHQTTRHHGHHLTHAPPIGEGFSFRYDPKSHRLAVVNNHKCWIYHPSDAEQSTIKDIHTLRDLEVKLIQQIDNTPTGTSLSHSDLGLMSPLLAHLCHSDWPIVILN